MVDVAYRFWSLIHRDLDPLQQEPTLPQPPMLATVAVDCGGSLHFELWKAGAMIFCTSSVAQWVPTRKPKFLGLVARMVPSPCSPLLLLALAIV